MQSEPHSKVELQPEQAPGIEKFVSSTLLPNDRSLLFEQMLYHPKPDWAIRSKSSFMMPHQSSGLEPYSPTAGSQELATERSNRPKMPVGVFRLSSRLKVKFQNMRQQFNARRSISKERTEDENYTGPFKDKIKNKKMTE